MKKKKVSAKKRNPLFMEPVQPDNKLAMIVGLGPITRIELTKRMWHYIKVNGLQDKKKRTMLNADEPMKAVF